MKRKFKVMIIKSTNINKTNNHLYLNRTSVDVNEYQTVVEWAKEDRQRSY